MRLAREGFSVMLVAIALSACISIVGFLVPSPWHFVLWILALALAVFVLYFFRDPVRVPPEGSESLVLSPADGKIVEIIEEDEKIYLKSRVRRISIFLSPLNVHVNRVPVDGVVESVAYIPGEYLLAWEPKASERNERSEIVVRHSCGARILFKQIAGFVARRIVYHLREGDRVRAGDRFGIVKFGSRMDVFLPLEYKLNVNIGDAVFGGTSVLAFMQIDSEA